MKIIDGCCLYNTHRYSYISVSLKKPLSLLSICHRPQPLDESTLKLPVHHSRIAQTLQQTYQSALLSDYL